MSVKNIGLGAVCVLVCGLVMAQTSVLDDRINERLRNGSELSVLEKFSCTWMHCEENSKTQLSK